MLAAEGWQDAMDPLAWHVALVLAREFGSFEAVMEAGGNLAAVLCHDIGKGRDEDHSILGARLARPICTRLGLSKDDVATVEWLVRNHLIMSDVAQKRDLSDPRTVNGFAKTWAVSSAVLWVVVLLFVVLAVYFY